MLMNIKKPAVSVSEQRVFLNLGMMVLFIYVIRLDNPRLLRAVIQPQQQHIQ